MSDRLDETASSLEIPPKEPALLLEHLWRLGPPPDAREFLKSAGELTPAQIVSILCVDQWQRWHAGERVLAETHLHMHPALQSGAAEAFDLIFGEFLVREELGETPFLDEYLQRFPQYAALLHKQFELHRALESGSFSEQEKPRSSSTGKPGTAADPAVQDLGWPAIPGYEIQGELGQGGMGRVFKALHLRLHRVVALKIIRRERLAQVPEAIQRFQSEARAAAQLSHPNIVVVYDADRVDDTYFIAMEYVEGIDLHEYVKATGALPIERACDFIRQASLGLQHAHERGMVHRDIKPSNLLVTMPARPQRKADIHLIPAVPIKKEDRPGQGSGAKVNPVRALGLSSMGISPVGVIKILDMGLALTAHAADADSAQWTQEGTLLGTPDFIAPEQAMNSHAVDIRADLYSLGCTFYFLLAGKAPFGEHAIIKKLMMHQAAEPRPIEELRPQVPLVVRAILRKLMAKRPEDRYQTPSELAEALALASLTMKALPLSAPLPETKKPAIPSTVAAARTLLSSAAFKETVSEPPPAETPVELPPPEPSADLDGMQKIAVLEGHRGWVTSVAFAPNRETLASGGVDGVLRLWDLAGTEPQDQTVPQAHDSDITALAFAPDSKLLATGSGTLDGLIRLWEYSVKGIRPKALIRAPRATVDALALSPDCKMLAAGGSDWCVRVWDVSGPEPVARNVFKGHADYVRSLAFSRDGATLASASKDGAVRLWNLNRFWSRERAVLRWRWGQVHAVAFSSDSKLVAFGCLDQTVRVWDVSGDTPQEKALLEGHPGVVRLVQFNPEGSSVVSICDAGRVLLWDVATEAKLREWLLPRAQVYSTALTADGRYLATGNSDGTLSLFRLYPKGSAD